MRPSSIAAFVWGFAVGMVLLAVAAYVLTHKSDPEDTGVPVPPSGYEYCTTGDGQGLTFCPKERTP